MIKLVNVRKSFGSKDVIKLVNLHVKPGERVTIIGPSGCGKSTLLRLITGLQKPDSGSIVIDGQDITMLKTEEIQKVRLKMGMLFQSGALFDSMNVAENVAFPLLENYNYPAQRVAELLKEKLEMVGMSGTDLQMPANLSGGMRKRIGLARAIAGDPQIILYDEPTTGLDPILSTIIEDLIVKLNDKLRDTSVIVTHQISTILRTADRIIMMYKGELLPAETPETIFKSKNPIIKEFISGGLELAP
jgi:phospholipid/cholesterol/gamma-HCH transport system ATP-binding protein